MGCIYRKKDSRCVTCRQRLARTSDREACRAAGHDVRQTESKIWWIKYNRAGKSYGESSGSERKGDAIALLRDREGDIGRGKPVTPKLARCTFEDASADLLADYRTNGKRSLKVVERRVNKHLAGHFAGWRMCNITTVDVRAYIVKRQTEPSVLVRGKRTDPTTGETLPEERRPASNAEINRELALLKRMFTLAIQAGKLLHRPHIPMLREDNVRTGFFEPDQYRSVLGHLPAEIRPVIEFAYITGWRIASEVLPMEWKQVDFVAGEVRLNAGTTKNGDGRVFPFTAALRDLLTRQQAERERLQKRGHITPYVFVREVAEGRGGDKKPQRIISFAKAWKRACRAAGCPGRIPHDLRRTAIRNLVRAGIPERVAMQLTGHKTRSVFERYNIVSDGDLRDAARRLDATSAAVSALR